MIKFFLLIILIVVNNSAISGPIRDRIFKKIYEKQTSSQILKIKGIKSINNISYGTSEKHKMDVFYCDTKEKLKPVIFMVHGGAWMIGDKMAKAVVENKVKHWCPKGYIVISVNYNLLPNTTVINQVNDISLALKFAQDNIIKWGGDNSKFIVMGHSAGGHLVSVLASSPSIIKAFEINPWLATISIDSAALDLVEIMQNKHYPFYDKAFGKDLSYWKSLSPFHLLQTKGYPFLAICSTKRANSYSQSEKFIEKAKSLGMETKIIKINLTHKETNELIGKDKKYTNEIDAFINLQMNKRSFKKNLRNSQFMIFLINNINKEEE